MAPEKRAGCCDCKMNNQETHRPVLHWRRPWLYVVLAFCAWIAASEFQQQVAQQARLLALDLTGDLSALPPNVVAAAERLQSAGASSVSPVLAGLARALSFLLPLLPFSFLTTADPRWSSRRAVALALAAVLVSVLLLNWVSPLVVAVPREPSWVVPALVCAVLLCVLVAPRPWLLKLTGRSA
jgi:hypothetical protein